MSKNPMEEMPQADKSPKENILSDFKVGEVNIGGEEYYCLDKYFTLPSGIGEKVFKKSRRPNGLEEHIKKLIKEDEKKQPNLRNIESKKN